MLDIIEELKEKFDTKQLAAVYFLGLADGKLGDYFDYEKPADLLIMYAHLNFAKMRIESMLADIFTSSQPDDKETKPND
jgi:hypothetical protein